MIMKYSRRGIPLYIAALTAALFAHGLAVHWDEQAETKDTRVIAARHT